MSTIVLVQALAWGATVEVSGDVDPQTHKLDSNQERQFVIDEGKSMTLKVTHGEKPKENPIPFQGEAVPGRAQNDELLLNQKATAQPPVGNKAGTDETTIRS